MPFGGDISGTLQHEANQLGGLRMRSPQASMFCRFIPNFSLKPVQNTLAHFTARLPLRR